MVGVTLALNNGASEGVAMIRAELAMLDRTVADSMAMLERFVTLGKGLHALNSEMAPITIADTGQYSSARPAMQPEPTELRRGTQTRGGGNIVTDMRLGPTGIGRAVSSPRPFNIPGFLEISNPARPSPTDLSVAPVTSMPELQPGAPGTPPSSGPIKLISAANSSALSAAWDASSVGLPPTLAPELFATMSSAVSSGGDALNVPFASMTAFIPTAGYSADWTQPNADAPLRSISVGTIAPPPSMTWPGSGAATQEFTQSMSPVRNDVSPPVSPIHATANTVAGTDPEAETPFVTSKTWQPPVGASWQPPTAGSSRPPATASEQRQGTIFLDGARLGSWIIDHLAKRASRPISGTAGIDPRINATFPGAPTGA
jgi:hypothetical protein